MKLSKIATISAIICSLPFVLLATDSWIIGGITSSASNYECGEVIYAILGYPLTQILYIFKTPPLQNVDNWWAIPLLDVLFIFQWIIWAQLIALFVKFCIHLGYIFSPKAEK